MRTPGIILPEAARAAFQLGVQILRALGMRPNELEQCLTVSTATLKRYAPQRQPDPAKDPPIPPSRPLPLLAAHRRFLTLYWVRVLAFDQPVPPPIPKRPLLGAFCPVCLHNPSPTTERRPPFPKTLPQSLAHAILIGLAACEAGYRPCASSPARFASLMQALRISPWHAALFLGRDVAPTRWWVRSCMVCERPIVTESPQHRRCESHAHPEE